MSTKPSRRRVEPWVGPWLQELRLGAAMKREQIAERLKRNLSAVSRIESGVSSIPADDLPVVRISAGKFLKIKYFMWQERERDKAWLMNDDKEKRRPARKDL